MTRISCLQIAPLLGDLDGNLRASTKAVVGAVGDGADVVVLPELVTSGYLFRSRKQAESLAVSMDHPVFQYWARAADRAVVIGGFCELGVDGALYNSAAIVDRTGVRAVYRKTHLWDREKLIFAAGDGLPPVIDTVHGRIGVLICYDLEFPEMTRQSALAGADLLAVPTNWPLVDRPTGEHPPEVVIAMAAARVNRMVVACCDRVGTELGQRWTGGSSIIDHQGWIVASAARTDPGGEVDPAPEKVSADIDLSVGRHKGLTANSDLFGDRRPELYEALARSRKPSI